MVDIPRSLADKRECERRRSLLLEPHMRELTSYVRALREKYPAPRYYIPDFDPHDGGVNAKALFLFEKPGRKTSPENKGSGFISRNNNDKTAENTFNFMRAAKIPREQTCTWNTIPFWDGDRSLNTEEKKIGLMELQSLIGLLKYLKVIMLVGNVSKGAEKMLSKTFGGKVVTSAHPSPIVYATNKKMWDKIPEEWAEVKRYL